MENIGISGATRELVGENLAEYGPPIMVCDTEINGHKLILSAWVPTKDELARLNKGHAIILGISDVEHPQVFLCVDTEPVALFGVKKNGQKTTG